MKIWLIPGLVLLAASTGVNALALVRLARLEERPVAPRPLARPAAVRCAHEEPGVREVATARTEVVRPVEAEAAAPSAAPAGEGSEVADLLRDQDAVARLFLRLDQLRALRTRLPREKREEAALRFTAETLGLEPLRFAASVRIPLEDLRRAAKAHEEQLERIAAGGGSVPAGLADPYEDQLRRAREDVAAGLGASPLHQLFRQRLEEWMTSVLAE